MRRKISRLLPLGLALLATLAIAACGALNRSDVKKKSELEDFVYALRWQQYDAAANFFTNEHRRAFLDQFDALGKDLTVMDVRLKRAQPRDSGRSTDVLLEMDYQLLPSASLKTLRIDQTWSYFETADSERSGFLITTPFPKFPEETSRARSRSKGALPP